MCVCIVCVESVIGAGVCTLCVEESVIGTGVSSVC